MGADTEQGTTVERKTTVLSKKVWSLESKKEKIMGINTNGTIPISLQKSMKENKMYLTDYVDPSTSKRRYVQKINGVIEIKDI